MCNSFSALLAISVAILFSSELMADRLEIENTYGVRAERYHQFRAIHYKDNGESIDVTRLARFQVFGVQERGSGEFYLELPRFGNFGRSFTVNISATYLAERGPLSDTDSIQVDTTPDFLEIRGNYGTRSGGTLLLRAYGIYAGKRVELTQKGRWQATHGQISSWGHYRAPIIRDRRQVIDRVTFNFGRRSQSSQVIVRN